MVCGWFTLTSVKGMLFLLLCVVAVTAESVPSLSADYDPTYCADRYRRLCQGKGVHIACQFSIPGPGESCVNYTKIKFNRHLKGFVTQYINRRRQRLASGKERVRGGVFVPQPEVVMQVYWDQELAMLAQRLADQCHFVHDDCRATVRYPYAGQTVGEVKWRRTSGSDLQDVVQALRRVLDAWWGERRRVTPRELTQPFRINPKGVIWGHFSQLAVWRLRAVGCGAVRHSTPHPRLLLVCDFSHTNMLGQRTVVPGRLQQCPIHTARKPRSQFPLLCASIRSASENEEDNNKERHDDIYDDAEFEDYEDLGVDAITSDPRNHYPKKDRDGVTEEHRPDLQNRFHSRKIKITDARRERPRIVEAANDMKKKVHKYKLYDDITNAEKAPEIIDSDRDYNYDDFEKSGKQKKYESKKVKEKTHVSKRPPLEVVEDVDNSVEEKTEKALKEVASQKPRFTLNVKELIKQQIDLGRYGYLREKENLKTFKVLKKFESISPNDSEARHVPMNNDKIEFDQGVILDNENDDLVVPSALPDYDIEPTRKMIKDWRQTSYTQYYTQRYEPVRHRWRPFNRNKMAPPETREKDNSAIRQKWKIHEERNEMAPSAMQELEADVADENIVVRPKWKPHQDRKKTTQQDKRDPPVVAEDKSAMRQKWKAQRQRNKVTPPGIDDMEDLDGNLLMRQKGKIHQERPGAKALLSKTSPVNSRLDVPVKENVEVPFLTMDQEDTEQLFRDTGFNPQWRKHTSTIA